MDRLFSPWRANHVANASENNESLTGESIFCDIAASDDDVSNLVLWRGTEVFVVMNLFPYTNGHLMVVPYRCVGGYDELTPSELFELSITVQFCLKWLNRAMCPEGFNVGLNLGRAAGAGIPDHLHMHVVPRWSGDTNFTSTVGDFRVIPEELQATYQKLADAVVEIPVVLPGTL